MNMSKMTVQNPLLSMNISAEATGIVEYTHSWDYNCSEWWTELFFEGDRSHFLAHFTKLFYVGLYDGNVSELVRHFNILKEAETPEAFFSDPGNLERFVSFFREEEESRLVEFVCFDGFSPKEEHALLECTHEPYCHRSGCATLKQTVRCPYKIWKDHSLAGEFLLEETDFTLRLKSSSISSGYSSNQVNKIGYIEYDEDHEIRFHIQRGTKARPIYAGDQIQIRGVKAHLDPDSDVTTVDNDYNGTFKVSELTEEGHIIVVLPELPQHSLPHSGWIIHSQEVLEAEHIFLDWR